MAAGYYKIWQKERKAMFNRLQIKVYESRYIAYLATSGSKRERLSYEHAHYVYRQIK